MVNHKGKNELLACAGPGARGASRALGAASASQHPQVTYSKATRTLQVLTFVPIYSKSMYIIHAVQFISDMVGKISLTYVGDLANQGSVQNDMRVKSPHAPRTLEDILTVRPTLQYCGLLQERVRMPL